MHVRPQGELTEELRTFHDAWEAKDREVRSSLLAMVEDDILYEFACYATSMQLWDALRNRFGVYTPVQLSALHIALESYKMNPQHTIRQHMRHMTNMLTELQEAGQVLTESQKIHAIFRSLPDSWEPMRMQLAHSENINTVDAVRRHIEFEEDRLKAAKAKAQAQAMLVTSSSQKGKRGKRGKSNSSKSTPVNNGWKKEKNVSNTNKGKKRRARKVENRRCFRCNLRGHLAASCTNPPQVRSLP